MEVKSIKYNNYRNIRELTMTPISTLNVLVGDNAQGKTNFLEGIYFGATGRPLRNVKDTQLIQFNTEECHIQLLVEGNYTTNRIDVHIGSDGKKTVSINGISAKKLRDLLGTLYVVCFSPEDLSLIKDDPARRRRFLDMELCQMDKVYYHNLQQYHNVLRQRNHLLKEIKRKPSLKDTLSIWTEQLDMYGKALIIARESFLSRLSDIGSKKMEMLTGGKERLSVVYKPNSTIENLYERIESNVERDILMGNTQYGPHKDDIAFVVNDLDSKTFGSQGQQRSTALAVKLAEIDIIVEKTGEKPVLLLDDVFSELDESRQKLLMQSVVGLQSFITCTGVEDVIFGNGYGDNMLFMSNGKLVERS